MKSIKKLLFIDTNPGVVQAWVRHLADIDNVDIRCDSIVNADCDAVVSPANSYGIMDGGVDLVLRDWLGGYVETELKYRIRELPDKKLPVGEVLIIERDFSSCPILISAPTMEIPSDVSKTQNAFKAMLAVLRATNNRSDIKSIAITGLCTLTGMMDYDKSAIQIRQAIFANYLQQKNVR